jgi:hypothetical protein
MDLDGEGRYRLAVDFVLDGRPLDEVAEELRVDRWLVAIWAENRKFNDEVSAELEASDLDYPQDEGDSWQ